jgi:hypothetical protein
VGAVVAGFGLIGLWIWMVGLSIERRQKVRLEKHIQHLHDLMEEIEIATTDRQSAPIRAELLRELRRVIQEFEQEKLSARNLRSFQVVWRVAYAAARERRTAIRKFSGTAKPAPEPAVAAASGWSFARLLLSKLR